MSESSASTSVTNTPNSTTSATQPLAPAPVSTPQTSVAVTVTSSPQQQIAAGQQPNQLQLSQLQQQMSQPSGQIQQVQVQGQVQQLQHLPQSPQQHLQQQQLAQQQQIPQQQQIQNVQQLQPIQMQQQMQQQQTIQQQQLQQMPQQPMQQQQVIGSPQGQPMGQLQGINMTQSAMQQLQTNPTYSMGAPSQTGGAQGTVVRSALQPQMQGMHTIQQGMTGMQGVQGVQGIQNVQQMGIQTMQGVQVISQPQFITQQQYQQQQLMIQQAMQAQNIQPQIVQQQNLQTRPGNNTQQPKSPGIGTQPANASSQSQGTKVSGASQGNISAANSIVTISSRGSVPVASKQGTQVSSIAGSGQQQSMIQQQPQVIGGKPMIRQGGPPVVIGQIAQNQTPQLLNNQIRFSTQPTFLQNPGGGQIITSGPTVLNVSQLQAMNFGQNIPLANNQQIMATQGTAILNSQPLYIRATGPGLQPNIISNVQAVQPNKQQAQNTAKVGAAAVSGDGSSPLQVRGQTAGVRGVSTPLRGVRPLAPTTQQVQQVPPTIAANTSTVKVSSPPQVTKQPGKVKTLPAKPKSPSAGSQVKIAPQPKVTALSSSSSSSISASSVSTAASTPPTLTVSPKIRPAQPVPATTTSMSRVVPPSRGVSTGPVTPTTTASSATKTSSCVTAATTQAAITATTDSTPKTTTASKSFMNGGEHALIGNKKQAIVKPVLTHIIEGFVIQESTEPFPVQRSSMLADYMNPKSPLSPEKGEELNEIPAEEENTKKPKKSISANKEKVIEAGPKLQCEFCKKVDFAVKFRRSKRFCSISCAKRYNVGCSKRMGLFKSSGSGGPYVRKNILPKDMLRPWKRGIAGRVTTGPIKVKVEKPDNDTEKGEYQPAADKAGTSTVPSSHMEDSMDVGGAAPSSSVEMSSADDTEERDSSSNHGSSSDADVGVNDDEMSSERQSPLPPRLEREEEVAAPPAEQEPIIPHQKHPRDWNAQEVYNFIKTLPGCTIYANEFLSQEIDGMALMLLKEDHLMTAMNMKLGPALKMLAKINSLKAELGDG